MPKKKRHLDNFSYQHVSSVIKLAKKVKFLNAISCPVRSTLSEIGCFVLFRLSFFLAPSMCSAYFPEELELGMVFDCLPHSAKASEIKGFGIS